MKVFKYKGTENYELTTEEIPKIKTENDVIVKITITQFI